MAEPLGLAKVPLEGLTGEVYNLGQRAGTSTTGLPLLFGISVAPAGALITPVHLLLKGHVAWGSDYHEWFEIDNVPTKTTVKVGPLQAAKAPLKIAMSKLNFEGSRRRQLPDAPERMLELDDLLPGSRILCARKVSHAVTPLRSESAAARSVPFQPTAAVTPKPTQYDSPAEEATDVHVASDRKIERTNTADIKDARVTLPEGVTLNPSAAHGLEACTAAQLGEGDGRTRSTCPAGVQHRLRPDRNRPAAKSLTGNVYLGKSDGTTR